MAEGQLRAGETLEQFAERMGISLEELLSLNPNLTTGGLVEGLSLALPDRQGGAYLPGVATSATQAPVGSPTGETAPTGELAEGAQGLFAEMLKEFTTAFQTFVSAPSFIRTPRMEQAQQPGMVGEVARQPTAGHSLQEARFLRGMEPELRQRFSEQAMREMAETGEIPSLTAAEFLRGINVREEMEMAEPGSVRGGRRYGPPSITPRRLRF